MTKEYCQTCPFFTSALGYLEPGDAYWVQHPDVKCQCAGCPGQPICEQKEGEKPFVICVAVWLDAYGADAVKKDFLERVPDIDPKVLDRELGVLQSHIDKAKAKL